MNNGEGHHRRAASVFGHAITPEGCLEWGGRGNGSLQWRSLLRRFGSTLVWAFCGLVAFGSYKNVFADDSALRDRTEALARRHAGCDERCRVLGMQGQRSVLDYRVDYQIEGVGAVRVVCRRAAILAGEHMCRPD